MSSSRLSAIFLALAVLAALPRPAKADDAQAAAAAAMQAAGQAGAPNGGAPGAGAKKKDTSGFSRALTAPQIERTADGGEKRAKSKKSSKAKTNASKYKTTDLSDADHVYRFNENGEPLTGPAKKKAAAKTKKKTSSDADDRDEKPGCSSDEPCAVKNADADAL